MMSLVSVMVDGPGQIYQTPGCTGDHFVYESYSKECGNMAGRAWSDTSFSNPKTIQMVFNSVASDGNTAMGFRLKIEGFDMMMG